MPVHLHLHHDESTFPLLPIAVDPQKTSPTQKTTPTSVRASSLSLLPHCCCAVTISQVQSQAAPAAGPLLGSPQNNLLCVFAPFATFSNFFRGIFEVGVLGAFDGEADSNPPTPAPFLLLLMPMLTPGCVTQPPTKTTKFPNQSLSGENSLHSPCFSALSIHQEKGFRVARKHEINY